MYVECWMKLLIIIQIRSFSVTGVTCCDSFWSIVVPIQLLFVLSYFLYFKTCWHYVRVSHTQCVTRCGRLQYTKHPRGFMLINDWIHFLSKWNRIRWYFTHITSIVSHTISSCYALCALCLTAQCTQGLSAQMRQMVDTENHFWWRPVVMS